MLSTCHGVGHFEAPNKVVVLKPCMKKAPRVLPWQGKEVPWWLQDSCKAPKRKDFTDLASYHNAVKAYRYVKGIENEQRKIYESKRKEKRAMKTATAKGRPRGSKKVVVVSD